MTAGPARYPGRAPIDAYGNGGFRFADMSHRGSILCLPSGVYAWAPAKSADIDASTLAQVVAEKDAVGLLLMGTGPTLEMPDAGVRSALAAARIALEVMDTGAAARTYNV